MRYKSEKLLDKSIDNQNLSKSRNRNLIRLSILNKSELLPDKNLRHNGFQIDSAY